jgi:hypothetical protein
LAMAFASTGFISIPFLGILCLVFQSSDLTLKHLSLTSRDHFSMPDKRVSL